MPLYPTQSSSGVPVGHIIAHGSATAPTGYLVCDGSAISRTAFAALFNAIGTNFGTGDGSTTFNLPDLQGRMPVGIGTHADANTMGENDGTALASRTPKHKHTVNDPGHSHTTNAEDITGTVVPGASGGFTVPGSWATATVNSNTTGVTVGPQSTTPTDTPAYQIVQYVIKH
jgi:microcystin-dependent protein